MSLTSELAVGIRMNNSPSRNSALGVKTQTSRRSQAPQTKEFVNSPPLLWWGRDSHRAGRTAAGQVSTESGVSTVAEMIIVQYITG